ncbi:hypothetical protein SAMN05428945_6554 [Streptomyces sp. 2224.1]|uniref:hypothetical protein n=1 Tax=unclassified Streptomyces TaxID=2593676 RepID=UPI0008851E12|nr:MULTISPECIES: hypothetical protein [unclassified Streptomyces]PBC85964.1 hypothetical protein BX261_6015 [Streptomyces sp. 2321.6]SDR00782.1 hypothetical protein SAMN05216511_1245 [Streptomyces sp. KS_16]SED84312.1 hypothetical protein SAMN05428940_6039 [Streptomyces sp. 2133.1]SED89029.1 hypothetical protein SAMN05428954_1268 [Streptomyces sp. 2112.3]SEE14946.1 hypothetical protein SAMN05428945_6554 [Streptomyces sp. 2224.1]
MTVDAATEGADTEDALGIDAARSACVLIGVDRYSELEPLRSVRHNLTELAAALADEAILGIPAICSKTLLGQLHQEPHEP